MNPPFELLERCNDRGTRLALLENGTLLEYYEDESVFSSMVGAVLLGKVERVLPAVKAAFIKLGAERNGFLPLREQDSFHLCNGGAALKTDEDVLVQVKKDPKGEKGAFLTRDIALPGQYALLMPQNRFIGVSKRVEDERERSRAKKLGASLAGERFGLIVRHAALSAPESEVRAETEALWVRWQQTASRAQCMKAPALLYQPASMTETALRDYAARHPCTLYTEDGQPRELPQGVVRVVLSPEDMERKWTALRVESQLNAALERKVPLKGGGDLVIDQREALQTIDVNTGTNVEAADGGSLPLAQNLAAVPEIARQLRLRNLCGTVLIDFINMDTRTEREQVLLAMKDAVADDRVKTVVHDFTALGLLEITRKRTRDSLQDALTEPCKNCGGSGRNRRTAISRKD